MKKLILSTLFLIGIFGILHAQQHKLGLYPTSFIFSEITAEYEFLPLTTNLGFGIQITGAMNASPEKYSGCMLAPFLKIYFSKDPTKKIQAFYFKPILYIGAFQGNNVPLDIVNIITGELRAINQVNFMSMGIGAAFGKQWTLNCGLSFDISIGLRYIRRGFDYKSVESDTYYQKRPTEDANWKLFPDWVIVGPGRLLDAQIGVSYVFPTHAKK